MIRLKINDRLDISPGNLHRVNKHDQIISTEMVVLCSQLANENKNASLKPDTISPALSHLLQSVKLMINLSALRGCGGSSLTSTMIT